MAKKKTSARKTRQTGSTSKAASVAPSNASSPSPQPQDLVLRRRKNIPVRSPSQGDQSKGIVFSFRIQNNPELTMAVDILSYDQQNGPPEDNEPAQQPPQQENALSLDACSPSLAEAIQSTGAQALASTYATSQAQAQAQTKAQATTVCPSHSINTDPMSPTASSSSASESRWAAESINPRMNEQWTSDPSLYRSSNVVDLSRNLLILHSRKPTQDPSHPHFHPYNSTPRRKATSSSSSSSSSSTSRSMSASPSEEPSPSPCLSSGESSESSSPSSSPATPSSPASSSSLGSSLGAFHGKDELSVALPEPLDQIPTKSSRFLRVRGLGASGRRMQVILVS